MNFRIETPGTYINMFEEKETASNDVFSVTLDAEDAGWYRFSK
jgi:hypothetical protein